MTYIEIKEKIEETRRTLQNYQKHSSEVVSDLSVMRKELDTLNVSKEEEIERKRRDDKKNYELEISFPYDSKIKKLEDKKTEARKKTDTVINKIKSDDYRRKLKDSKNISEEIEHCDLILEKSKDFYGERFSNVCTNIVVGIDTDSTSVEEILPNVREKMKYIKGNKDYIGMFNDKLDEVFKYEEESAKESMIGVSIVGGLFVIIGIAFYQLILLLVLVVTFLNVYKSKFLFDCLKSAKSLKSNIIKVEEELNREVDAKIQSEVDKVNNKHNLYVSKVNDAISTLDDECVLAVERALPNFIFDDSEIQNKYQMMSDNKKSRIDMLESDLKNNRNLIIQAKKELEDLEIKLAKSLGDITSHYLCTSINPSDTFPSEYLIDIENDVPLLHKSTSGCALYTYEKDEDVDSFIQLLFFQTISRIKPEIIKFSYLENKFMGRLLFPFRNDKDNEDLSIVDLCTDFNTTKKHITDVLKDLQRRMTMFVTKTNIVDYNEEMSSLGAILETYRVILHRDPELSILSDNEYTQVLINGGSYGLFTYLFINIKEFNKSNYNSLEDIINKANSIHHIDSKKVKKRAKMFYLSKLEED